jgi:hypothetical protein
LANWRSAILSPENDFPLFTTIALPLLDPRWAITIDAIVREVNQARAIDEVVNALKPVQCCPANAEDAPLRVVNGISTQSSPVITVAPTTDRIPGRPGNSTIRRGGGLVAHPEQELEGEPAPKLFENNRPLPQPKMVVTPPLATLDIASEGRIG